MISQKYSGKFSWAGSKFLNIGCADACIGYIVSSSISGYPQTWIDPTIDAMLYGGFPGN